MGCLKLPYYNQEGGLEKSSVYKKGHLGKKGNGVKKCNNYSPFGLTFNESVRVASTEQRFKYNDGAEREKELNLNIDYTQFRNYDYAIGRWWQIDPLAADLDVLRRMSPYHYSYNNPIRYNDPNGDCPCLIPFIPPAIGALEALLIGTAAVGTGYVAYERLGPDYDNLKTGTLQKYETAMPGAPDPNKPNFKDVRNKIVTVSIAVGLVTQLIEKYGKYKMDLNKIQKALEQMDTYDVQVFIGKARSLLYSDELLTDRQYILGVLNPHMLESATNYDIMKDVYGLERGLSEEEKAAEEEARKKGKKASKLVNSDISNLQEGTYTWNGEDWVIED